MKVGDLVIMPGSVSRDEESVGIVVKLPEAGEKQQTPRVGIFWADGAGQVDWEPMAWLKVINESR